MKQQEVLVPEGQGSKGGRQMPQHSPSALPTPRRPSGLGILLCPSWASPSPTFPPCLGLTSMPLSRHPAQHTIRPLL